MKAAAQNIWLILAALVSIFLCGSGSGYVFGSLGGKRHLDPDLDPKSSALWSEEALTALQESLALTPAQVEQLKPVLASTGEKVTRERERALLQIHLNILKVHDDVRPFLTAQQQKELESSRGNMVKTIQSRFSSLIGNEGVPGSPTPPKP